jgi:hypothetical protein
LVSEYRSIGKISRFGFFFLLLTAFYTAIIVFFPEIIPATITAVRPIIAFIIKFGIFAFPLFMTGIALFVYNQHYKEYIEFVNSFLNNIMLRHQHSGSFNSPVFLNATATVEADQTTVQMLDDLEKNNIIRLEDDTESYRKAIYFTDDFQEVLSKKMSNEN